jgi:triacylglycerol lipase
MRQRAPSGDGRAVLLVAGFLAPEQTLTPLARWLRSSGWRPVRARIGLNTDCSQTLVDRLAKRLEDASAGTRATVIGQSRGGMLARALAVQRPDLVDTAIGLGAPVASSPETLTRQLRLMLDAATGLGSLGLPGVMTRTCVAGACCERFRPALIMAPDPSVRLVSIWSHIDGVVSPQACHDPHAESREVRARHRAMGVNAAVWREIASVLTVTTRAANAR